MHASERVVTEDVMLKPSPMIPKHPRAPQETQIVHLWLVGEGIVRGAVHEAKPNHLSENSCQGAPQKRP